jgi:hypothetical protein
MEFRWEADVTLSAIEDKFQRNRRVRKREPLEAASEHESFARVGAKPFDLCSKSLQQP